MQFIRSGLVACAGILAGWSALAAPLNSKAIVQTERGLALQTVPTPKPAAGQVLIKVYAAGVNPVDWKKPSPIPGLDAAGVIDSVGPGVTAFKAGDAVLARVTGGYAEYAIAGVDETIPKPKSFTFEQAAAVPIAGIAGYRAVEEAKVSTGQRVAIIGAAGGAGDSAVQIAKLHGAKIIAVGHSSQEQYLKSRGVDEFVAFDKEDVAARVRNVDVGINLVDGQASAVLGYVKRGGRFTSIMGAPADGLVAASGVASAVVISLADAGSISEGTALRALARLADQGKYTVNVTRSMPLAEAARAQELLRGEQAIGKTVLVVDAAHAKSR